MSNMSDSRSGNKIWVPYLTTLYNLNLRLYNTYINILNMMYNVYGKCFRFICRETWKTENYKLVVLKKNYVGVISNGVYWYLCIQRGGKKENVDIFGYPDSTVCYLIIDLLFLFVCCHSWISVFILYRFVLNV